MRCQRWFMGPGAVQAMQQEKTPREVRIAGLKVVAGCAAMLLAMRLFLWWQMSSSFSTLKLPSVIFILPPVYAAFGLTGIISGRDRGWLRIPLVVIFSVVLIALTFMVLIPRGYKLM